VNNALSTVSTIAPLFTSFHAPLRCSRSGSFCYLPFRPQMEFLPFRISQSIPVSSGPQLCLTAVLEVGAALKAITPAPRLGIVKLAVSLVANASWTPTAPSGVALPILSVSANRSAPPQSFAQPPPPQSPRRFLIVLMDHRVAITARSAVQQTNTATRTGKMWHNARQAGGCLLQRTARSVIPPPQPPPASLCSCMSASRLSSLAKLAPFCASTACLLLAFCVDALTSPLISRKVFEST
jgi:hypothetical protein